MARNRKMSGRSFSLPAGIALGLGVALTVTVLGAMLLAALVVTERAGEEAIGWGCMVILPLASAVGSMCAFGVIRHRRLLVCGVHSGAYYLALLAVGLLFGGMREGLGITAVLAALGGAIAFIPGLLGGGSGARRHKIPAFR